MATRAIFDLKSSIIKTYTLKTGVVSAKGKRVIFSVADNNDQTVDLAGAESDLAFGTIIDDTVITGVAAGTGKVQVALDHPQIVPMIVGTGGATRGTKQKYAADGVTDLPANGGGTLPHVVVGIALQSGVVGDLIGVMPCPGREVSAT